MKKDLNTTVQWITRSAEAWITICVPRVENQITWTNQDESDYESARTTRTCNRDLKYLKIVAERTWSKLWRQLRHAWAIALVVLRPFCPLRDAAAPGNRVDTAHQKSTADAISYVYVCVKSISCHFFIGLVIYLWFISLLLVDYHRFMGFCVYRIIVHLELAYDHIEWPDPMVTSQESTHSIWDAIERRLKPWGAESTANVVWWINGKEHSLGMKMHEACRRLLPLLKSTEVCWTIIEALQLHANRLSVSVLPGCKGTQWWDDLSSAKSNTLNLTTRFMFLKLKGNEEQITTKRQQGKW